MISLELIVLTLNCSRRCGFQRHGTILGPMMFLVHINDMQMTVYPIEVSIHCQQDHKEVRSNPYLGLITFELLYKCHVSTTTARFGDVPAVLDT